jgi:hypothetical protein
MMGQMTTDEIVHWIGEMTAELARRTAQQPVAQALPWEPQPDVRVGAATPPRWQPPRVEPKARPFTSTSMPIAMAPMPSGGLAPGTPLTPPSPNTVDPTVAALIAQLQAQMAGQVTPAPQRGVITATAKTDPEAARVMMGVPPRPDGVPPINGAGVVAGSAIVEPA